MRSTDFGNCRGNLEGADGGTIDQLRATLVSIEDDARARIAELRSMIEEALTPSYEFTDRWPINAIGLRFELDHEGQIAEWAAWAREQVATWRTPTDAGDWNWAAALR